MEIPSGQQSALPAVIGRERRSAAATGPQFALLSGV